MLSRDASRTPVHMRLNHVFKSRLNRIYNLCSLDGNPACQKCQNIRYEYNFFLASDNLTCNSFRENLALKKLNLPQSRNQISNLYDEV